MCTEINHLAMQIKSQSIIFLKKLNVVILSLFLLSLFRITANYYSHCHRYKASNDLTRVNSIACRMESRSMERFSSLFLASQTQVPQPNIQPQWINQSLVQFKTVRENLGYRGNYFTPLRWVRKITDFFFFEQGFAANPPIIEHLYHSENKEYNSLTFKLESCFLMSTSEQHCSEIRMEVQVCPFGDHVGYSFYERA